MPRVCMVCSKPAVKGRSRCADHGPSSVKYRNPDYDSHYKALAKRTTTGDVRCHICGEGKRPGDPMQADHVIPLSMGGTNTPDNLKPAHQSCNIRKGGANR